MDRCLNIDVFGREIKLKFNGRDKFRTRFGTFCTLIIVIILIFYTAIHIPDIADYRNALPIISRVPHNIFSELYSQDHMVLKDRDGNLLNYNIADAVKPGLFFAFGLGYEKLIDPRIGQFVVKQKLSEDASGSSLLPVVPCAETDLDPAYSE